MLLLAAALLSAPSIMNAQTQEPGALQDFRIPTGNGSLGLPYDPFATDLDRARPLWLSLPQVPLPVPGNGTDRQTRLVLNPEPFGPPQEFRRAASRLSLFDPMPLGPLEGLQRQEMVARVQPAEPVQPVQPPDATGSIEPPPPSEPAAPQPTVVLRRRY